MIITIGGEGGSGKSTVAKLLAQKLGFKHFSQGDMFRQMAKDRNISFEQLGELRSKDKSIDQELDIRQQDLGHKEDNFVIDGRLSFHFIPFSLKIFLRADLETRAKRVMEMDRPEEHFEDTESAKEHIAEREEANRLNYLKVYGIDVANRDNYDAYIDTTKKNVEAVVQEIVGLVEHIKI